MQASEIEFCRRMAKAIAKQFGSNCGVVVRDLQSNGLENSIVAIENGHVPGPSPLAPDSPCSGPQKLEDCLARLTKTEDGRLLKSSTVYLRDGEGRATGSIAIYYDLTPLVAMEDTLRDLIQADGPSQTPESGTWNVSALLEELLEQSVRIVGKPVEQMGKEDKVKAIRFLNGCGAFLITKSGPRVCSYFGISKYTLYSYIDEGKAGKA